MNPKNYSDSECTRGFKRSSIAEKKVVLSITGNHQLFPPLTRVLTNIKVQINAVLWSPKSTLYSEAGQIVKL